ncbi:MAG TPA: hypothetical protein VFX17_02135 [Patescibacteria group bacterium]|nr:hypothetical protein [Patescibacteria group bacterium]
MKLTHLADQKVIISRLVKVTGTNNRLALSTVTASMTTLQAMDLEKTLRAGGVPGSLYKMFCGNDIDIQEGDQIKDEAGAVYTVRKGGVTRWHHGAMDYYEIYLTKGSQ